MSYLFWSQIIFWLTVVGYLYFLKSKSRNLENEINIMLGEGKGK